jgi:phospholipid/cholesterol/gamma-HCH transport system substrate-binding protein
MSKRISPTTIGIFVVGGFALVVAAIVVAGSGNLFKRPARFVCMFPGNVNGLRVGAAVKVRGVQIGTVQEIKLALAPGEGEERPDIKELRLPVIIGIDPELVKKGGGTGAALSQLGFESMISRGLSARLDAESLLTGLLYVDLDLRPNVQPSLTLVPGSGDLREIPTVPTTMEAIQQQATEAIAKLDKIDLNGLVNSITQAANSIKELTGDPAVRATIASLPKTVANLDQALSSIKGATDNLNREIDPAVASFTKSSKEANATMKDTRAALVQLQAALDADSPLAVNLNQALEQFADTTQAIEELTDYLQRNPAALVRGKYVPETDR